MDNKIKILILLILMCLTVNTVFASDMNDTLTLNEDSSQEVIAKENNNTVLQASKNFGALYQDIHGTQASEINLTNDYIYQSFWDTHLASGVPIKRNVTINGNGHTIDGYYNARIFEIADDSLNIIIKDLHFVNGETTKYGGAISGKCTVINCTFYNNLADKGGALYKASAINCSFELNRAKTEGGAIYIDNPNVNVENCTFVTNYAGKLGGAIAINEVIGSTISNCTFTRNQAENAGSMSVRYSQKVNVTNSKFNSNSAGFNGGAIYYDFALQNILDNCDFENNAAPQDGGAITWILSNGNITNNRFKRNSANGNGGAIYADVSNTAVMIEHQILTDCNFTENSAKNGGALYCGGSYRVTDGTLNFIKNTAKENGGAVYCINSSSFSDSLFLNNKAQNNGGAVYCNDSCRFFGSSFINNNAKNDGGALYANNYGFLFDNQFLNNSARTGGAMYCNEHCTISKADFINNTAEDDGGAIYSIAEGLIYNIKFNNNSAHHGGAVYIGKYNDIGFCEFTRNYAYQGPAVYTEDNFNEIYNTTFLKNKQELSEFDLNTESYKFNVQLLNSRYLFNSVYSWFPIDCHNITFWNGTVTTMSELDTMGGAGINFTIEVYDSNNKLVKKEIRTTDNDGKIVYDYFDFDGGNYTFKVTHDEDDYYLGLSKTFKITVADFDKLQALLVLAKDTGIINLTRNFTYSIGYDTLSYLGVYSENLTIYGNGYTIDASNRSVSFADELTNITFLNCSFKNGMDFHLRGKNILISDCNFENTGYFRSINASSCQIINCNFDRIMKGSYFSPFEFTDNKITIIKNSNFTNNLVNGSNGGAIYLRNNSYELIMDCNFINNTAEVNDAGAIYGIDLKNFNLVNSSFINNTAIVGGALVLTSIEYGIITIDGCMFLNNTAKESASAFKIYGDPVIKNSIFLNNQAPSSKIEMDVVDLDTISVNFEGQNDYINAIVVLGRLSLENVTYWDGTITNTNKKSPNRSSPGQNITINAYDKNDNLIFQTVEKTDENGQLIYAIYNLPYETKYVVCYHEDDAYYARSANVTRNVTRMADFDRLQLLINAAGENGVVNLTRNYTYAEGFETSEYLYINYNNITINGNGYSINFNETGFIYINEANGITLNNISFTGGERQSALMYIGGDCEINDCNFANISLGSDNVIHQYKINTNLAVNNTNFINITATAIRVDDFTSASICNSDFINNTQAISAGGNTFNGVVKSILISECSFTNNSYINNSAALNLKADTIKIENSNFTNNKGTDGGAIYARANEITVNGSNFFNNSADKNGGAIYIADSNKYLNVDNSSFRFNSADVGPAIYCAGGNCTLNNVTVLDNRGQPASLLEVESTGNNDVVMKFEGKNNYINGIYSKSIEFHNVVYWNGEVVNSDDAYPVENDYSGQKITLEIYNSDDNLVENVTLVTDGQNKIYYKLINGENGNYTFKAYHLDDNYYSYISGGNGTFESIRPLSSVNINIDDGTEFYYSNCNISFDIINKTVSRVVITNIDGTQVYINQTTADDYVIVDLDPSEDYYKITVYNDYTFDYVGSQDSKLFKILKVKPSIIINPISDIYYNNEFVVTFDGENFEKVNVTVFDVYGNIVFSEVSSNKYVTIPVLPVGTYNITVTSDEDKYHSNASNSSKFNIIKAYANVTVSVDNVVYGNESMIVIYADVDGVYTVDVNGTFMNVTVDGNIGKCTFYLGAGKYYANVTSFDNGNYSINSTNAIFEVYKAINNVKTITSNVTYGSKTEIYVVADVDGVYTVDVNGTIGNVTVEGKVGKLTLLLGAGKYYANVTYSGNGNYSTIISNASFEVYKAVNNVEVSVDSIVYGNESVIYVVADVDGVYTVDVNGNFMNVTVVNNRGKFSLSLGAGKYYANVTSFDNGNYSTISKNAEFEVYPAINNIKVLASSVTYGNESVIYVVADVDGVYTLDLNGDVSNITVVNGLYSRSVRFGAGKYYANVTFENANYNNIITNAVFEVYKAVNNVHVTVTRFSSINDVILGVDADVDGVYTLDFNGNISSINVVNGTYSISLHLAEGKYYANVTFENANYSSEISNIEFEISKIINNVKVIVKSVTYGNASVINVVADVDGVYTLDLNGDVSNITVVNGKYSRSVRFGAGKYYANVTFDDENYKNIISNAVFEVYPAINNVYVLANNVIYGQKTVVYVVADVDDVYTVDINGTIRSVNVVDKVGNFTLSLGAGRYYANATYENANYSNVISNDVFRVYKAINNVKVVANSVVYGNDVVLQVIADADGVYTVDVNGTFSSINVVNGTGSKSLSLVAGKYYANVTSFDNGNYSNIISNAVFEVYKAVNNVKVSVDSVVYGEESVIVVSADVDGVYTVDVNGTIKSVPVVNNVGYFTLSLAAGKYYANASFEIDNYISNITNASFEVYKAVNYVQVIVDSVIYGNESVIVVSADVDGVYTVDVNGTVGTVVVVDNEGNFSLSLGVGKYYANVTSFDNGNYSTVSNTAVFEVYKAVNNIKVIANSVIYGNESVINVVADVDGVYTLDFNGQISTINVVNGTYSRSLRLGVGKYYANVTYENGNYSNVISNAVFEVLPAVNNVKVIASSVTYGNESVIYVVADVDGVYTLDLNGQISNIDVVNGTFSKSFHLGAGKYYANVTYVNGNYSNVISNAVFEVYKAVNNVHVVVIKNAHSGDVVLEVLADVDGVYTLDLNGNISTIMVENGIYAVSLNLPAGKYYANVTFENENYTNEISNIEFEISKEVNNIKVNAISVVYGNDVVLEVVADVDGVYTLDLNGNISTINVVNGKYSRSLRLGAGKYYANVTFGNDDYKNIITNAVFEVYPAVNNVKVIASSVTYGRDSVIVVSADVDGVYTLDLNGNVSTINVVNGTYSKSLRLGVGKYYANVTYENGNYSAVVSNAVFEVYPAVNNVKVVVSSVTYGNETVIVVSADVDGVYTLDLNGNVTTIEVVNGTYSRSLRLGVGKYYANVTFDDGNYSTVVSNAVFEVYKAVNNVYVMANNVDYGEMSVIFVVADVEGVYTVDVNGTVRDVNVTYNLGYLMMSLGVGSYYANVTYENANYSTIISNTVFEVSPAVNKVEVNVDSVAYGKDVLLEVIADVDGNYTLDLNGNVSTIEVVGGKYSISLNLPLGKYYANVTFENGNYSTVVSNAVFEVYKAANNVYVIANSVTYGDEAVIYVVADVDGVYTVDVNGTIMDVAVVGNVGNFTLSLGAGKYYANVTFDDGNYSTRVNNAVFEVYKALNNVQVSVNSVTYGRDSVIVVSADVDGVYTLDLNGNVTTIEVVNGTYSKSLRLGVGKYYANVTFDDGNYSTVVSNDVFEVYKAINNVKVIASSVTYGNSSVIVVVADVDGVYTVDVNGTIRDVTVVGQVGSFTLSLGAGKYYANVTFEDGNYSTRTNNAVFEVYKALNNVYLTISRSSGVENVTLTVFADVDGVYTLDFNGNVSTINVVDGTYSKSLALAEGKYYANVTFENENYTNEISNIEFEISKVVNNVQVVVKSVTYGNNVTIRVYADVDGVYTLDVNGTFSTISVVNGTGFKSLNLAVGKYYANVTFADDANYTNIITNASFEVYKAVNNVYVIANSIAYGDEAVIYVVADVDGVYTVDVNGTIRDVAVADNLGNVTLSLAVGHYYANVTFDNGNYSTVVSNNEFEVYKALNNVKVSVNSVTYGRDSVIVVSADVDGVYNLDLNGNVTTIEVVNGTYSRSLRLGVGKYYANVTFDDGNYSTVVSNAVFEVYKAINNVKVIASSVTYGNSSVIVVVADVDGVYSVDVNGTIMDVAVVGNLGNVTLSLGAGHYYANVTFDDANYSAVVSNDVFDVYKAKNNVKVTVNNVKYGDKAVIHVVADVDGNYTLDVNGTIYNITVVKGKYTKSVRLGVGRYYANVTFADDANYTNIITNASFEVYKAVNNVYVIANSVTYGEKSVIIVAADVDGNYTVDVNGTYYTVVVDGQLGNVTLSLGAGHYYANVTYENENYSTIISNDVFEVYKALNNVKVSVNSVTYGNESVIVVSADVDGVYTLDLNGEITTIEVVNGSYSRSVRLGAGKYYANVTFEHENYSAVISNAVFEVYKAVNNVYVMIGGNMDSGEVVLEVIADVDGVYILDFNGDVNEILVENGTYSISLNLPAGKYYANVTFENENYTNDISNIEFEISKVVNNVKVITNSVIYGNETVIYVVADVDGVYTLDLNGDVTTIDVVNGTYSISLNLPAGKYYANVTFDNDYYSNIITNAVFEVYKAENNVKVSAKSVTYGKKSVIIVSADVDGVYTVDVNGTIYNVTVVNNKGRLALSLGAGKYYANVTFDNGNYSTMSTNAVFEVYKAVNNVYVSANSVTYGENVVIYVTADVGGVYTVDVNGTIMDVSVVDNIGNVALSLGAGSYYANVTFDSENYTNIISNDVFEVYKAVNNVKVIANSVIYGDIVVLEVVADVDGNYTLDFNGDVSTIEVVNGKYSRSLSLGVGKYYANVTALDNGNYSSVVSNAVFEVYKAINNVKVNVKNVTYGKETVIVVSADVDGVYTLDFNGQISTINVVNGKYSKSLRLAAGKYYANVTFVDDANYTNIITNAVFKVHKAVNNVKVNVKDVPYGQDVVLEVVADVDGVYILDLNGDVSTIEVVDGRYSVSLHLGIGKYYANVTFDNGNYSNIITNAEFEVYKAINNVIVIAESVTYGEETVITVLADVDGVYVLDVNGNVTTISVVNGTCSISLSLDVGSYYANVSFSNPDYDSIISNATFKVLPVGDYDMTVVAAYGDDVYVYVLLPRTATGNVTMHVAGKDYTVEVNTGIALFTVPDLEHGYYNVTIHYGGDDHYVSKTSNITVYIKKVMIDAYDVKYGWAKSITYSVKLIDEYGNLVRDKEVMFSINGKTFKSVTNRNGIASVSLSLNIGTHSINITYRSENVTRNITVVSRFSGNKNINMYYFDGSKYTFKIYGNNGKLVGANQVVVIKLNKKTYKVKTDKNGVVKFTIPNTLKKFGKYTITATYKGQTIKNTIKVRQILTSKKTVKVKKTAKKLVVSAKLKKKLKGKKIIFKFKGKKYTTKTNKNGIAKLTIKKNVIKKLNKGRSYKLIIYYNKINIKTKIKVI